MGGGLRIDGETNFSCRNTLRGQQTLKEEGAIQGSEARYPEGKKGQESCYRNKGVKPDAVGNALNRDKNFKVSRISRWEPAARSKGPKRARIG
jgi:hypothetical protein